MSKINTYAIEIARNTPQKMIAGRLKELRWFELSELAIMTLYEFRCRENEEAWEYKAIYCSDSIATYDKHLFVHRIIIDDKVIWDNFINTTNYDWDYSRIGTYEFDAKEYFSKRDAILDKLWAEWEKDKRKYGERYIKYRNRQLQKCYKLLKLKPHKFILW